MVDAAAVHRKLVGNVALHLGLVPERRFLRRNLRHVLDAHEHLLQQRTFSNGTASQTNQAMISHERREFGLDELTMEMLYDLAKGQKPVLRIAALQIRHPQSKARIEQEVTRPKSGRNVDNWLPPPESHFSMPCTVNVGVAEPAAPKKMIFSESRPATIRQYKDDRGISHFDIDLDQPFLIKIEKLFAVQANGETPFRWKRTTTVKYLLDISINCRDSEDTAELLSCLEGKDLSSYSKSSSADGVLHASWEKLPECPSAGQLLTLKRSKAGHKAEPLDPEYRLEVAMGWLRRKVATTTTLLEESNKIRTRVARSARQLPTPTASEDLDKEVETYAVVYKYQEGLFDRTLTVNGLNCPLCPKSLEQPSIERLRLHCATFHDHFKFETEDVAGPAGRSAKTRHVVWISLAEKEIEKERDKQDAEKINWIAPERPFDISAHLRGQDDWTGTRVRKSKGGRGRLGGTTRAKDSASSGPIRSVRKRPALDEVEDLPEERPRKRRAPNVPSVKFYHPLSKLAIPPGTYIADGDESIDEAWLQERDRHELDKLKVDSSKKEFIIAYNEHMEREQTDSTMFVREALVRFTRRYGEQLRDIEWRMCFIEKLNLLQGHRVITAETADFCYSLVKNSSNDVGLDTADDVATGASIDKGRRTLPNGISNHVISDTPNRSRKVWKDGEFVARDAPTEPRQIH